MKQFTQLWVVWALGFLSLTPASRAETLFTTLNGLEIGIDRDHGTLVYLGGPATGAILEAPAAQAGPLDLAYPTDAFAPLRLAARYSKAQVKQSHKTIKITWNRLAPSRNNELSEDFVSATVTLTAAPDGRSIIFTCDVDNQSKLPVPQILFPDLVGLLPMAGQEQTALRLGGGCVYPFKGPIYPPETTPFYPNSGGWTEYPASGLYGINSLRWLDFGGYNGGLSIFQKQWSGWDAPTLRTQRLEADPAHLRLAWDHQAMLKPGQRWQSGEFWFTPHEAGWAKGIEPYREYVRQNVPARRLPPSVRDGLGFRTIWMIQSVETDARHAVFKYSDLPGVARECAEYGLPELCLWGWCRYTEFPIGIRPELGTEAQYLEAVRQCRARGVNVAPFVSIAVLKNRYAPIYKAEPNPSDWTFHPDLIPQFRPYYTKYWDGFMINTSNAQWQGDVERALKEWIDKGVPSFVWDVFTTERPRPDLVDLIQKIRPLALAKDPQATFGGETMRYERDAQVLDYTWSWVNYLDVAPVTNLLPMRINCNVEASPLVVKKGFIDNLFLNVMPKMPDQPNGTAMIAEQPEMGAALKQCAALRRQFLPYFSEGVFIGDSLLCAPANGFVKAYVRGGKLLVLALNDASTPKMIDIQSRLDGWLNSKHHRYAIKVYNEKGSMTGQSELRGDRWTCTTPNLSPLEMALFEIEAL